MSLRLFCDQCVPAEINETPRRARHDAMLLRDALPIRSPDPVVIGRARELDDILVSLNGDFSDIVAYSPADFRGIIAIQLHNHPEIIPQVMRRLTALLAANSAQEFYHGKLFIVEAHRIRVRV